MKIPKKIKVGGKVYDIEENYNFSERFDRMGHTNPDLCEIKITHKSLVGKKLNQQVIEEVFWHEVVHCIDHTYNAGNLDEDTVKRFGEGLYQVLNDNKFLK